MQISNKRVQLKKKKKKRFGKVLIIGLLLKAFILIQKIHPKKGISNPLYFSTISRYSRENEISVLFGIQTLLGNYLGVCIRVQLRELDHLILTIHDE